MPRRLIISLLALSALAFSATAGFSATSEWTSNPHGQVRLIAPDNTAPQSPVLTFGVEFKPVPGWMVYYKIPGDAGYAPKFDFKGSSGFSGAQILWPRPKFFLLPGDIKEYGYEDNVVYPVQAQRTKSGAVHIAAKVEYLTCKESCVPYRYNLVLDLPAGDPSEDAEMKSHLQKFIGQVPPDSEDVIASLVPERISTTPPPAFWLILLFGFIGGLILNVMPCVLPVLSIKLFGLLQHAGEARIVVVRDALASAAGIIVSFLFGAGLAIAGQRAGQAVGWGIQFQNPGFVIFLIVIVLLFALNLWGVFEINLPPAMMRWGGFGQKNDGPSSYFFSGVFATLLATPCSAPFLGTAMGFALSQPAGTTLAIFASAGTGMALPYLLIAVFPGALRWLPKPGAWMVRLRAFLGFLLFATALWLGWVFVQQRGWIKTASVQTEAIAWIPFNEQKIDELVASGKPVFVDVTAEWCLTCKVNERFVIETPELIAEFKRRNVVMMRADWTNQDLTIGRYLAKNGRAGIPFYALYAPQHEPTLLSELLTKKQVRRALQTLDTH